MKRGKLGWAGHGDLIASVALIVPLWLGYGAAVAATKQTSALDLVSRSLWRSCGRDAGVYLAIHAVAAAIYLLWLARSGRRRLLALAVVGPLAVEAALYALTLVAIAALFTQAGARLGAATVVAALGAGVSEELVFRLGGVAGGAALARHLGLSPRGALIASALVSSALFAAAHHVAGEPWQAATFAFRMVAGLGFAAVFWRRSLAHAVYAHVLYDLIVAAT